MTDTTREFGLLLDPPVFADRVMAAVAREPAPTPARSLVAAWRARSLSDARSALLVAWHLSTIRRWPIDRGVRARSFALVLSATLVLAASVSVAAAAAVNVVASVVQPPSGARVEGPTENGQSGVGGDEHREDEIRGEVPPQPERVDRAEPAVPGPDDPGTRADADLGEDQQGDDGDVGGGEAGQSGQDGGAADGEHSSGSEDPADDGVDGTNEDPERSHGDVEDADGASGDGTNGEGDGE